MPSVPSYCLRREGGHGASRSSCTAVDTMALAALLVCACCSDSSDPPRRAGCSRPPPRGSTGRAGCRPPGSRRRAHTHHATGMKHNESEAWRAEEARMQCILSAGVGFGGQGHEVAWPALPMRTCSCEAWYLPAMTLSSVVFPLPLPPMMAKSSPLLTDRLTSFTSVRTTSLATARRRGWFLNPSCCRNGENLGAIIHRIV